MKSGPEKRILNIYLPLLLFLTGFIWKLIFISHRDISLDEPFTIFNAQRPIGDILNIPAQGEPNPPLFMILMHGWIRLFGTDVNSVRMLPLLFSSLTIPFLYFTGKRYFGLWAGIIGSGLFIFSTLHFFHGLEARTYSLFTLATAASLYFFLGLSRKEGTMVTLGGLVISNIVLVYAHYFGWFVIFSQFISSLLFVRKPGVFLRITIAEAITCLAFLPMAPLVLRQFRISSRGTWLNPPASHELTEQLYAFLNHKEVYRVLIWLLAAGVVLLLIRLIRKKTVKGSQELLVPVIWWIVPYVVMFSVSSAIPMFNSRYVLFTTVGLFMATGALAVWLFQGNKFLVPLAALVLLSFMFARMKVLPDDFGRRDWKHAVGFAGKHAKDGAVTLIFPKWSDVMFTYHYDRKIFREYERLGQNLAMRNIYSVWGIQHVRSIVAANPGKRIVYIQDGNPNPGEDIIGMLDSAYRQTSQQLFPEKIDVRVFDPR